MHVHIGRWPPSFVENKLTVSLFNRHDHLYIAQTINGAHSRKYYNDTEAVWLGVNLLMRLIRLFVLFENNYKSITMVLSWGYVTGH